MLQYYNIETPDKYNLKKYYTNSIQQIEYNFFINQTLAPDMPFYYFWFHIKNCDQLITPLKYHRPLRSLHDFSF